MAVHDHKHDHDTHNGTPASPHPHPPTAPNGAISPKIAAALRSTRFRKQRRSSNSSSKSSVTSPFARSRAPPAPPSTKPPTPNMPSNRDRDRDRDRETSSSDPQATNAPPSGAASLVMSDATNLSLEQHTSISIQNSLQQDPHNIFNKILPNTKKHAIMSDPTPAIPMTEDDTDSIDTMHANNPGVASHNNNAHKRHNFGNKNHRNKPKIVADFRTVANSLVHKKRQDKNPTVRYIAQIDVADYMIKKSKVGTSSNMYVVLEGTQLSVSKNKQASARYRVNVRVTPVSVDVERKELRIIFTSSSTTIGSSNESNPTSSGKNSSAGDINNSSTDGQPSHKEKSSGKTDSAGTDGGKNRNRKILRLIMEDMECAVKWKEALKNAVYSDINEYYSFEKTLGSGAFGEVMRAKHNVSNEIRAIKIIKRGDNLKSKEHLDSEIQVMKSISHPCIVQTYQIFDLRKSIYIVMEYVSGGDLFDFVAQRDTLTEKHGSQTMRSIFQAVEYLHCNSIVHRDLKPENILCANDSWPLQIKVSDFGFAHFLNPLSDEDNTMKTQVGTVYFMAPEIIKNQGHGPPVDLWACGVILYTILTGRLPFPGRNTTEYLSNVVKGKILFPAILWKGISEDAKSLVKGLLNLDPNKRLNSLGALQHRWIAWPDAAYGTNQIRRDRSNLHSRRRKLFKARKAIIAVAMANKFKATIPQVMDQMGDQTKKVAGAIESGVKKTADGIIHVGEGIAEGTKNIGENTKKVANTVKGGTKKVAGDIGKGVKKTVDGVENGAKKMGQGVKKTVDGVENGAKKVGHGMKKTADGIGQGVKKTADGIGQGVKKTADGIGQGVKKTADGLEKGVKVTGHAVRKGVDKMRHDRSSRGTEESHSQFNTETSQASSGKRRRARDIVERELVESTPSSHLTQRAAGPRGQNDGYASSEADYESAIEEHSETEEGWGGKSNANIINPLSETSTTTAMAPAPVPVTLPQNRGRPNLPPLTGLTMGLSNDKSTANIGRPTLKQLSGLTMGLSDESMGGGGRGLGFGGLGGLSGLFGGGLTAGTEMPTISEDMMEEEENEEEGEEGGGHEGNTLGTQHGGNGSNDRPFEKERKTCYERRRR